MFWGEFVEWTKARNLHFKEKKPPQNPGKLKHGIEKSNKLFEKPGAPESAIPQPEIALTLEEKVKYYLNLIWQWI